MFQLFQQRNFSALVNDTFTFFRVTGKNFFRNYLIINGPVLLVLLITIYLLSKVFFDGIFSSFGNPNADLLIERYFAGNIEFMIGVGSFCALLIIILTLLSYSFPVLYMQVFASKKEASTKEIISLLKKNIGKILLFPILSLITFLPIAFIVMIISFLLIVILIGIPIAIIVIAALGCWVSLSYFDYLTTDNGFFTSIKNGFQIMTNKFWHNVGSTVVFILMVQVVQTIITMIPYFIGIFSVFSDSFKGETPDADDFGFLAIMMIITMVLSILVTYILNNFMLVNQGIIYYSNIEEQQNNSLHSEIDLIGFDSE